MNDKLTVAELAKAWDTSAAQLWRWRNPKTDAEPLPCYKAALSGDVRFVWSEVEAWRKRNLEPKAVT